jgi:hypothetical protein
MVEKHNRKLALSLPGYRVFSLASNYLVAQRTSPLELVSLAFHVVCLGAMMPMPRIQLVEKCSRQHHPKHSETNLPWESGSGADPGLQKLQT